MIVHTDGACSGNPGPGGWGAVLMYGDTIKEISHSTDKWNNRCDELAGAAAAAHKASGISAVHRLASRRAS